MSKAGHLAEYVEDVVYDFAVGIDPDDEVYPDHASLSGLRADLSEVIDGCVADWEIVQREAHDFGHQWSRLRGRPEPDTDEAYDRMRDQKMLGIDVPDGVTE